MATSGTLKGPKKKGGSSRSREQSLPTRSNAFSDRLQTWRKSIWRRRWLCVATAWAICAIGWAVITVWPINYSASAVVYADLAKIAERDLGGDPAAKAPVAALKSMLLADDVAGELEASSSLSPAKSRTLADDIQVRSSMAPLFVLSYEHRDPGTARDVIETLIGRFQTRLGEVSSTSLEASKALDAEISDHRSRIRAVEGLLGDFRQNNAEYLDGADGRASELSLLEGEVSDLEVELETAVNERDGIAEQLTSLDQSAPAEEPQATSSNFLRSPEDIETERKFLQGELANLKQRYAESHPYVVAVLESIRSLEAEASALDPAANEPATSGNAAAQAELEQRQGELDNQVSALEARLQDKQRQIELLQALTQTASSVEAELAGLEAEKQELEVALGDLQERRNGLGAILEGEAEQKIFRLIRQPEQPANPIGPSRLMALAAVLLGGSGVGAAVGVVRNHTKGVFESAWQLRQRFDVGVLGTISEVMTPADSKRLGHARLVFGLACFGLLGTFGGLAIAELTDQLAPLGDQLRTQLLN